MKSLFFNVSNTRYKISTLLKTYNQHIEKVDISSGLVFFDISLFKHHQKEIEKLILPKQNPFYAQTVLKTKWLSRYNKDETKKETICQN